MADFFDGLRLMIRGVGDMVKNASYSMAFGAGGLGTGLALVSKIQIPGIAGNLIALGMGFGAATLGLELDQRRKRQVLLMAQEVTQPIQPLMLPPAGCPKCGSKAAWNHGRCGNCGFSL